MKYGLIKTEIINLTSRLTLLLIGNNDHHEAAMAAAKPAAAAHLHPIKLLLPEHWHSVQVDFLHLLTIYTLKTWLT